MDSEQSCILLNNTYVIDIFWAEHQMQSQWDVYVQICYDD